MLWREFEKEAWELYELIKWDFPKYRTQLKKLNDLKKNRARKRCSFKYNDMSIYFSPVYIEVCEDPVDIVPLLGHELAHLVDYCIRGRSCHDKNFKKICMELSYGTDKGKHYQDGRMGKKWNKRNRDKKRNEDKMNRREREAKNILAPTREKIKGIETKSRVVRWITIVNDKDELGDHTKLNKEQALKLLSSKLEELSE